ncbi:PTH2 family peptidyl-tRNA hydrolase [Podila verticillata NRRL 6337]|nr:PTH2 family peptidyl-tRNA hydrolase [Podila verticillata NRRL 6337]
MDKSFTLGQVISAGAVGLVTGYLASQAISSQKSKASSFKETKDGDKKKESTKSVKKQQIEEDSEDYEDDEDYTDEDSEDEENEGLSEFDLHEEFKMVLVIRSDLGMGKGKAAAQCCHATLANYKELAKKAPKTLKQWEYCGQAKVTLKIENEEDMLLLQAQAMSLGLAAHSIRDAGRTQIAAGSRTVLAVGPGPVSVINSVTGHLKLY